MVSLSPSLVIVIHFPLSHPTVTHHFIIVIIIKDLWLQGLSFKHLWKQ